MNLKSIGPLSKLLRSNVQNKSGSLNCCVWQFALGRSFRGKKGLEMAVYIGIYSFYECFEPSFEIDGGYGCHRRVASRGNYVRAETVNVNVPKSEAKLDNATTCRKEMSAMKVEYEEAEIMHFA